jgi:maleamate amidohydrolase
MQLDDYLKVIPEEELEVVRKAGYGRQAGVGKKPALLVVDVVYNFLGDRPEPILKSIQRFRNSCGELGWEAVPYLQKLLAVCRENNVPIFFTTRGYRKDKIGSGSWSRKNRRTLEETLSEVEQIGDKIIKEVEPHPDEMVIEKDKPSAFFGTPLISYLVALGIDTVIVTGTTTSGCIRATVVDAFSLNYHVVIPKECVFDRTYTSHLINLFDMQMKYADVVSTQDAITLVETLGNQRDFAD